ncbi:MAG TPA: hypothetical protein VF789_02440 [Thermoanaerobaculia bacterium]
MKRKKSKKKGLQYVPGAAGDGLGFFPAVTCQIVGKGAPRILWIVHRRRQQLPTKEEALAAADSAIALGFDDPSLPSSPALFRNHLREQGFSDLTDFRVARSFDEDRRSVLGDAFQPAFGEEAARHDPVLHAALMEMVNRQIAENDPPEIRETLERLLAEGYSPEHARRMIGLVLALEITRGMLQQNAFDEKAFIESLRRLPELPPL